jgi:hypothetical protein
MFPFGSACYFHYVVIEHPLIKTLSVALNAYLSGIASRDEDGIEDRERETDRPPQTGETQSTRAASD